jgi:hypothetical protein
LQSVDSGFQFALLFFSGVVAAVFFQVAFFAGLLDFAADKPSLDCH